MIRNALLLLLFHVGACATLFAQGEKLKLEILNGHSGGGVLAVAVSTDGKFALTGSTDTTALLWELETGKQLRRFAGYHEDAVSCVQFSKDGRFVLTASYDSSAQLWETATGRRVHGFGEIRGGELIKHSGKILSCAISRDMKMVATAGEDKTARIWDFETGKEIHRLDHAGRVNSVAFSPDSALLLTGGEDRIARLYSTQTGKEERQFVGHTGEITSVAYSPDGKQVLTGSEDSTARLWDSKTTVQIRALTADTGNVFNPRPIFSVAFISNEPKLFLGSAIAITPDERHLLSAYTDDFGNLWDAGGSLCDHQQRFTRRPGYVSVFDLEKMEEIKKLGGQSDVVLDIAVTPNLHTIFTAAADNTSGLWNVEKGQGFKLTEYKKGVAAIRSAVFSHDGKWLVTEESNALTIRDASDGNILRERREALCWGKDIAVLPDSRFVLGKYNMNQAVVMLNADTLSPVWSFSLDWKKVISENSRDNFITTFGLSSDGKRLAIAGDSKVGVWNIEMGETAKPLIVIRGIEHAGAIVFSPDGKTIATASGGKSDMTKVGIGNAARANSVQLWDVETGREIERFGGEFKISANKFAGFKAVAYSTDGKYIAAGSFDGKVYLRNNETKELKKFEGHTDAVNSVKFAKDANGKLLVVSGSSDSTTRIWNAATGEELCALVTFRDGNWAVVQTRTGRYDAPNGGEIEGIQWVYGNETIALSQLKDVFYTPNLLPRLLGYNKEPLRPVPDLNSLKLFPKIVEQHLDEANARLTVKLQNRGGGIGEVRILVNGKLATEDARDAKLKADPNVASATIAFDLRGSAGFDPALQNKVEVITNNYDPATRKGYISSRGAEVVYARRKTAEVKQPDFYAVVGGVSNYNGDKLDLGFAAKDAEEFAHALELGARRMFCPANDLQCNKVKITVLSTSGKPGTILPTKENYQKAVADVARAAKPEDVFVVYLAGHGTSLRLNGKDTYLYLTQEAESASKDALEKPEVRAATAITSEELLDWLTQTEWVAGQKGVQSLKQVMILDTCAAGSASGDLSVMAKRDLTADQVLALERLKDRTGVHILMGSAADQSSYEANRYGQGLLTYSLLQGIAGGALDNGQVQTQMLFDHAVKTVPTLANGIGGVQQPRVFGSTSIPIGLITDNEKKDIKLALPKPVLLRPLLTNPETGDDDLHLIPELRKRLGIESSYEVVRRRDGREPGLVYIDDDSFPGGIRVTGTYTVDGETVRISAFLRQDGKTIAKLPEITTPKDQVTAQLIAQILSAMAALKI